MATYAKAIKGPSKSHPWGYVFKLGSDTSVPHYPKRINNFSIINHPRILPRATTLIIQQEKL